MERVSSAGLTAAMLRSAMSVQAKLAEKQIAQSSGLVSETYAELGAKASKLVSLETTLSQMESRNDNTTTVLDRVEEMYEAVGTMADLMTSLRTTLSEALSDTSSTSDYTSVGEDMLTDLAALMNLQSDGRYLFGGSDTSSEPVDVSALSEPTIPSTEDTSYYSGDDVIQSVKVTENATIEYGVTASESGFEKALRAANILANADTLDEDALQEAYDLATEALDELLAVQSQLSTTSSRLESYQELQETTISLLSDSISNIKEVDVAAVAVELSEYETILQAAYSAMGTLSSLSLVNYL